MASWCDPLKAVKTSSARVGLPGRHFHARAALIDVADGIQVGEIQPGMDAVRVQVHGGRHDVEVARAFAVPKSVPSTRSGRREAELRGGDCSAAIVVRVQGDGREWRREEVGTHPLDLVGMDVRERVFDRGGSSG